MQKVKLFIKSAANPAVITLVVSLVILLVTLFFVQRVRSFNSDDVEWQNVLLTWHPFSGQQVLLGNSVSDINKVPLLALLGYLFPAGRKLLFLEGSIFAVIGFTLLYISSLYFLTKAKVKLSYVNLLPFVWLASFGYTFAQLYLNANWRCFDMGLYFITFMLAAMVYNGDVKPLGSVLSKSVTLLTTILVGILIYSDPYYLYFTVAPIAIFSVVLLALKLITKRQTVIVYACIVLALIFSKISSFISYKAGARIQLALPAQFVSFDKLPNNVAVAIHGVLMIFGADFFGMKVASLLVIGAALNLIIVIFILYKVLQLRHFAADSSKANINLTRLWTVFFGVLGLLVFVSYASSTLVGITAYRYLLMMVVAWILVLALFIGSLRTGKRLIAAVLLIAIIFNVGTTLSGHQGFLQAGSQGNIANGINYDIINTVEAAGYTKGYGIYWQAQINTYLSQARVSFLPVLCDNGRTGIYDWLVNSQSFNQPASKSFYLVDPTFGGQSCTVKQVIAEFGKPHKMIMVSNKTLLFYNFDLLKRM